MAEVRMKGAILLKHLSSVSDAVKDLKIDVKGGENPTLSYSFAAMTHYLEVTEGIPDANVRSDGSLFFSDIPKSIAFLNTLAAFNSLREFSRIEGGLYSEYLLNSPLT